MHAPPGPGSRRTYAVDVTVPGRAPDAFDRLMRSWDDQVGDAIPVPPSRPVQDGDYRIRIRHSKVADAVVEDIYSESIVGGTGGGFNHLNERVVLHVVRRGTWHFARSRGRGEGLAVPAGRFVVRYNDPPWHFRIGAGTSSPVLILPAGELRQLLGDRPVSGPSDNAALRVLMAHAEAVSSTLDDLSPSAVQAARNAMVELARGVIIGGVDAAEPSLAQALAGAAVNIAEGLLGEPELSPRMVARELHVSVRSLHRAFASRGESLMAYVRRRRLERALSDLTAPGARLSVTEAAARWGFADSSHLIRACRRLHGQTPTEYARAHGDAAPADGHQRPGPARGGR